MSQPEYESIVNEIRSARIAAPAELRERIRELATAVPPAPPRREVPWRRLSLVLVPAAVALAFAAALTAGLVTSGKSGQKEAVGREAAPQTTLSLTGQAPSDTLAPLRLKSTGAGGTVPGVNGATAGSANLPTTAGRAQLYEAELTLKVKDLSTATKRALRLTQAFNGYVRSVEYGSGTERGTAYLVLRVPVGSVQEAIVRFSALGAILDQHVSIQDVQPQLDTRFRQMQSIRDRITKLQARLESPTLSGDARTALENELVAARRQLLVLKRAQAALERQTSYATVSLDLRTTGKAVVVPQEPGRIGRALHQSGSVLLDEAKVLVYVLIVGAPFFLLLGLGLGSLHVRRRRVETRLLSTS